MPAQPSTPTPSATPTVISIEAGFTTERTATLLIDGSNKKNGIVIRVEVDGSFCGGNYPVIKAGPLATLLTITMDNT